MGQIVDIQNHNGGKMFTYIENGRRVTCFLNGNPSVNQMAAEGASRLAAQTLVSMRNSARGKKRSGKKRSGKKRSGKKTRRG
jgi:hypothetical protein